MNIKQGVLYIDSNLNNQEIQELSEEIKNSIEEIKEVIIDEKSVITSSCLFTLLCSIKKSKNDVLIPILEKQTNIEGFGNVTIIKEG